jgi:uncharacterized membrane protein YfcA
VTADGASERESAAIAGTGPRHTQPAEVDSRNRRRWRLGAIGLSGGLFSGLLGVGGGVVMVPLLVLWGRYGQRDAHAASLGAIVPISAAGVLAFGAAGEVRLKEAAALALGAIAGAQVGARVLARARERTLKLGFGIFLLLVAALMAVGR